MVYEVEIKGTLPTFRDYLDAYALLGRRRALLKRERLIERLITLFSSLPRFGRRAHIGIVWIRPNSKENQQSVSHAKVLILTALRRAGVVKDDFLRVADPIDLGFMYSALSPRTIVLISDDEDELFKRWDDLRA